MGTVVTVDAFTHDVMDEGWWPSLVNRVQAELDWVDNTFSTWKPESPLSQLRLGALTRDDVPVEITVVLDLCAALTELTEGWFDPWALPDGVDPTGLVKGWAADRVLALFDRDLLCGALVNAAGDIASFGGPTSDTVFTVGIVDPLDRSRVCQVVALNGALATSGEAERGAHLLNPFSRAWESASLSASVTGPDLAIADALATALAVGGGEMLAILDAIEGYEGFLIDRENRHLATPGFPFVMNQQSPL